MNRFFYSFFLFFIVLIMTAGCIKHVDGDLRLAVSPWIGYSPLYYAQEKGWLKDIDVKLIHSTSLHETVHYYQANLIDAFVATQYEASIIEDKNLVHYLVIDRSDGGDVLLSNRPLDTILKSKKVKTYFEKDSVNQLVFDEFIKKYELSMGNFDVFNKSQVLIKDIKFDNKDDILVVTYEPYATLMRNNGYIEICSTKDSKILVLDSLYVSSHYYEEHDYKLNKLENIIKQSYKNFKKDPKEFYEVYTATKSQDNFLRIYIPTFV